MNNLVIADLMGFGISLFLVELCYLWLLKKVKF